VITVGGMANIEKQKHFRVLQLVRLIEGGCCMPSVCGCVAVVSLVSIHRVEPGCCRRVQIALRLIPHKGQRIQRAFTQH